METREMANRYGTGQSIKVRFAGKWTAGTVIRHDGSRGWLVNTRYGQMHFFTVDTK